MCLWNKKSKSFALNLPETSTGALDPVVFWCSVSRDFPDREALSVNSVQRSMCRIKHLALIRPTSLFLPPWETRKLSCEIYRYQWQKIAEQEIGQDWRIKMFIACHGNLRIMGAILDKNVVFGQGFSTRWGSKMCFLRKQTSLEPQQNI